MYKLDLEKAEEPEIKLPTSAGSQKKQENSRKKHLLLLYWLGQSLWLCRSQQTGKFFKRWEYQTTLPASWEICVQIKKQQLEQDMEQQTYSKLGKEYIKAVPTSWLFNSHAEHIMQNAGLDEAQAGIKIARRNINNLRYVDDATPMAENEEELKSLSWGWKRRGEKLA